MALVGCANFIEAINCSNYGVLAKAIEYRGNIVQGA